MGATGERDPAAVLGVGSSAGAAVQPDGDRAEAAERALADNERRLRFLTDNVPTVMLYQVVIAASGARRFSHVSAGVQPMHGLSPDQVLADASLLYAQIHEDDRQPLHEAEERSRRDCSPFEIEVRSRSRHGLRWVLLRSAPRRQPDGSTVWDGVEVDITAAKLQEQERARLEERLRHAQKMESVGQLAGGVAHDFNNMLTAIMGNIAMVRAELPDGHALCELLDEAASAAHAAENLTRQLLAFSRKQVIVPKVLNLNDVAERMRKMLARVLGEDVSLRTALTHELETTRADPGQIEQILVNLAVNARDAMPGGGVLTLRTENVRLGAAQAAQLELQPGRFVLLAVQDDGTGMSDDVKARLFEPFFTTKGVGKGTGLGLSMVYGAVKQSGGGLEVLSGLGKGSEFRLYFPSAEPATEAAQPAPRPKLARGTETILVVEDEQLVRSLARTILERQGYQVVACASGAEALIALADRVDAPVDLLLTDLVMPGMSGRELAEQVVTERPSVRVLFTSGYSEDDGLYQRVADHAAHFLAKPYSVHELASRVREVLDGSARS
jgi:two-component system, cell cycle sensor histidine kinase and response regulator CckA